MLTIIFKLFLTGTSMLLNHTRIRIDARQKLIDDLMTNEFFNLKIKILMTPLKLL